MLGSMHLIYVPFGLSPGRTVITGTNDTGIIGTGSARCSENGVVIHAPTRLEVRITGTYQSILPDGQVAQVVWDDGFQTIDWPDGSYPGACDTILSANVLSMSEGEHIDWDLHDLSEVDNNVGHLDGEDNLGMNTCTRRVYNLLVKNTEDSEGDMIVGDSGGDEWTGFFASGAKIELPPDSVFALIGETPSGLSVAEDNALLKIEADGGALSYGLNWNGSSN